jgi:hypothetical protein
MADFFGRAFRSSVWLLLRPAVLSFAAWIALALLYLNLLTWAGASWSFSYAILVVAIFLILFSYFVIRAFTTVFRRNFKSAFGYVIACAVIVACFVQRVMIIDGVDFVKFYASRGFYSSCIKPAAELGDDAKFGFCESHLLGRDLVRLTVYDSSDGLALPEGAQSAVWSKFVASFEGGDSLFGVCSFSSRSIARHFYVVDFNCEEPPLVHRR